MVQEGPAFYKIVNEQLPNPQKLRIVGQAPLNMESEISEGESEEDEIEKSSDHLVDGPLNEFGEQELSFKDSDDEPEETKQASENDKPSLALMKDEEIFDDGSSDDEGVTVIRSTKDGTTKIVFSGEQKDITAKMLESIKGKLEKSKKNELIDFKVI